MSWVLDCYDTLPHGGGAHGGQNVGDQQGEAPPAPVVRVRFLPLLRLLPTSAVTSARLAPGQDGVNPLPPMLPPVRSAPVACNESECLTGIRIGVER